MKSLTPQIGDSATNLKVPRGSIAVGDRVPLPEGAEEPITVFVNGVEQRRGPDYKIEDGYVIFPRPILKESNLGFSRWAALYLGFFGTYRIHESVDIHYLRDGKMQADGDVRIVGRRSSQEDDAGND